MRVRYGKPIKVKSLLGKVNIPFSYTYANVTFYPLTTGTFHSYAGPNVLNIKYVNRQANHKYFLFLNTDIVYSWSYFGIWDTYNTGYEGNRTTPIKDGNNYYALINPTTSATNAVPSFQFGVTQNLPAIANYALIIDLTEIGLDNLTAQEFYNKYNKYFPLIATGEEITIDDKAGQVSLKKLLPDEYQEVEYIEGDGGQYMPVINTLNNRAINGNLTVGYKFQATVHDRAMYFSTITCNLSSGQAYSLGYINANSYLYIRWNQMVNSNTQVVGYQVGDIVEVIRTNNVETILKTYSLFTHGDSSTLTWKGRIYKYWLKLDNEYLFNWIPCYRKSDNVIGLYDLVSGTFSTNIGTGTFLKGPNVSNTISCKVAGGSSDIYYGYNQLAINGDFANGKSSWNDWNSTTVVTNGVAEITRTNTSQSSLHQDISANPSDKIYVRATLWSDGTTPVRLGLNGGISWSGTATTSTTPVLFEVIKPVVSTGNGCRIELFGTGVANTKYYAKEINAINLTTWFGAGKEPSTVEEFKEKFAKEYYGFCPTPIKLTRYQIEALPSYGYNQLTQRLTSPSYDVQGYHWEYGNDGWITFSGTPTDTTYFNPFYAQYIALNHKFYIKAEIASNTKNTAFQFGTLNSNIRLSNISSGINENIMTCNHEINSSIGLANFTKNVDIGTVRARFMLIDLTDWYGEGKEPATIEEFKQTFPNKYYAYSKKRLLNKYMINKLEN